MWTKTRIPVPFYLDAKSEKKTDKNGYCLNSTLLCLFFFWASWNFLWQVDIWYHLPDGQVVEKVNFDPCIAQHQGNAKWSKVRLSNFSRQFLLLLLFLVFCVRWKFCIIVCVNGYRNNTVCGLNSIPKRALTFYRKISLHNSTCFFKLAKICWPLRRIACICIRQEFFAQTIIIVCIISYNFRVCKIRR